ncbi:hypothetical protein KK083_10755 [Fulvivirgaceae bacterium PWU4]|uniref:Uncharacterized protein n=1 Tax=Chryseosolibacter histidini TaxID=2782349 RepID=A0AAP2GPF0_9BACT|nr:hypothetical protein [Chryseosolibacter histidini]MBT1697357.1 hypothetical protein [Chryseosolibacter histidini]
MKRAYSIVIALSISLFIYLFYRSEKTVVNEFMILILSFETYTAIKNYIINTIPLNKPAIFSLPGGLWVFCATALSQDFYIKIRRYKIQVVLVPILFAVGLEFCQLVHVTNGRFDIWDIAFYLLFWLLAYCSFQSHGSQQNILSPFTLHGFICLACFLSVYLAHVSR